VTPAGQRPDAPDSARTARGGVVRTTPLLGQTTPATTLPTSTDSVRTTPDNPRPDMSGRRAEVAAAIADAFGLPPDLLRTDPRL
jgi:hypothetical protein